jgi:DNA polymerase-3 subunit epsilon
VSFDVKMINEALKRMGLGKLKNKSIDTDDVSKI